MTIGDGAADRCGRGSGRHADLCARRWRSPFWPAVVTERVRRLPVVEIGPLRIVVGVSVAELAGPQAVLAEEIAASRGWTGIVDLWCVGNSIHLAAMAEGEVVGAASICYFGDGFCELHKLYVAPGWRRRDLARRLVSEVERISREREWLEIEIQISGGSEPFWARYLDGRDVEVQPEGRVILKAGP